MQGQDRKGRGGDFGEVWIEEPQPPKEKLGEGRRGEKVMGAGHPSPSPQAEGRRRRRTGRGREP